MRETNWDGFLTPVKFCPHTQARTGVFMRVGETLDQLDGNPCTHDYTTLVRTSLTEPCQDIYRYLSDRSVILNRYWHSRAGDDNRSAFHVFLGRFPTFLNPNGSHRGAHRNRNDLSVDYFEKLHNIYCMSSAHSIEMGFEFNWCTYVSRKQGEWNFKFFGCTGSV